MAIFSGAALSIAIMGTVLEIGIGSGHNLKYNEPSKVTKIYGVDPSNELNKLAKALLNKDKPENHNICIQNIKNKYINVWNGRSWDIRSRKEVLDEKMFKSKEEYTKRSDELRKKVIDYQSERRSSLDKIATQRAKSRETLIEKINPIVDAYIQENNISIVMDKKYMIGGLTEYDITKIIIERLNKELPSLKLQ